MDTGAFNSGKNDPRYGVRSGPKMNPRTLNPYSTGMRGFWAWARVNNPRLYASGLPAMRSRTAMAGFWGGTTGTAQIAATSADNVGPTPASTIDKIKEILLGVSQAYLTNEQMRAQKKVLDLQLARAQAGQPPLDIDMRQYGLTGPSVGVGLDNTTLKFLGWGAAALAAVYLIPKLLRR